MARVQEKVKQFYQRIFQRQNSKQVEQVIQRGQCLKEWLEHPGTVAFLDYLENQRRLILGAFEVGFKAHDGVTRENLMDKYHGKLEMIKNAKDWIRVSIETGEKYAKAKRKLEEQK